MTKLTGLAALGLPVLFLLSSAWNAVCLLPLWRWFFVPLGIPNVSIIHLMGICLVVGALTRNRHSKQEKFSWSNLLGTIILTPSFILLFGWLIHLL